VFPVNKGSLIAAAKQRLDLRMTAPRLTPTIQETAAEASPVKCHRNIAGIRPAVANATAATARILYATGLRLLYETRLEWFLRSSPSNSSILSELGHLNLPYSAHDFEDLDAMSHSLHFVPDRGNRTPVIGFHHKGITYCQSGNGLSRLEVRYGTHFSQHVQVMYCHRDHLLNKEFG